MSRPQHTLRQDGIKTLADLHDRCKVNTETRCIVWAGALRKASAAVWIPGHGPVPMHFALAVVTTGQPPAPGSILVPTCGNVNCANMKHRKPGTRGDLFRVLRPELTAAHKARVSAGKRAASPNYSPEAHADILASDAPLAVLAERHGMSLSAVSKIRLGHRWGPAPASSVFSWRP
jgi:hypothetical protein